MVLLAIVPLFVLGVHAQTSSNATINLDISDGTWNTGEPIDLTIVDADQNRDIQKEEDQTVDNPDARIPILITGDPHTLADGVDSKNQNMSIYAYTAYISLHSVKYIQDATQANVERLDYRVDDNHRGIISLDEDRTFPAFSRIAIPLGTLGELRQSINDDDLNNNGAFVGRNLLNYDFSVFGNEGNLHAHLILVNDTATGNAPRFVTFAGNYAVLKYDRQADLIDITSWGLGNPSAGIPNLSLSGPDILNDPNIDDNTQVMLILEFRDPLTIKANKEYPIVADFFSFGFYGDGVQASERVANQIIRVEVEETGNNTNTFTGTLEYVMINQLDAAVTDASTRTPNTVYANIEPISNAATFIAFENLTGSNAQVTYSDINSNGETTLISAQQDIVASTGAISLNADKYRVGNNVVITLADADLNTDSGSAESYTVAVVGGDNVDTYTGGGSRADPDRDQVGIGVVSANEELLPGNNSLGMLLEVTFDDKRWQADPRATSDGNRACTLDGLGASGFTLLETGVATGVFTGSFEIPKEICNIGDNGLVTLNSTNQHEPIQVNGKEIGVTYLDFRDAAGQIVTTSDSAAIGTSTGSINLDISDGTWNTGEPIDLTIVDADQNRDIQKEEDQTVDNPDARIPILITGDPHTLADGVDSKNQNMSIYAYTAYISLHSVKYIQDATQANVERLDYRVDDNHRGIISLDEDRTFPAFSRIAIPLGTLGELRQSINDDDLNNNGAFVGRNLLNYDFSVFGNEGNLHAHLILVNDTATGNAPRFVTFAGNYAVLKYDRQADLIDITSWGLGNPSAGIPNLSLSGPDILNDPNIDDNTQVMLILEFRDPLTIKANKEYPIVADFFSFGFYGDGVQASERVANQIIRVEVEETGNNTNTFTGTLEYVMINQLDAAVTDASTRTPNTVYANIEPISNAATFIAFENLTGSNAQVTYSDINSNGETTLISAQQDIVASTGAISLNADKYRVGNNVVITLADADLNTDSGSAESYTVAVVGGDNVDTYTGGGSRADPDRDQVGIGVVSANEELLPGNNSLGMLLEVTFDDKRWQADPRATSDGNRACTLDGLGASGFTLLETGVATGVFTGSFEIPKEICNIGDNGLVTLNSTNQHEPIQVNGKEIGVTYLDFRDAAGQIVTTSDSAAIGTSTIKIPPPSGFPSGEPGGKVMQLADFSQDVDKQTAQYRPYAFPEPGDDSIKRQVTVKPRVGEVFVPGKITLLTNPLFRTINLSFNCYNIPLTNLTNAITIPNIQPSEPIGLGYVFDDSALCKTVYNLISDYPVLTDTELRVTLYGKYDKTPYYFSPRDNMTQAQSIPACSSTNFDTNNQTLKGDTKMCHGVNGTNMVIITKRFGGFYGAADTVTTPTNPLDLDSAGPSLAVTTSKEDVSGIGTSTIFNITSGALGISYYNTGLIDTHGKHTFAAAGTTQKGHIYISPNTIFSAHPNSSPFKQNDIGKDCVRGYVTSTVHADHDLPDDISEGVAYGFAYTNGTDTCNYNSNSMARQFDLDTPFRIVLYDQAGKQAYSYLPAAGITISQDIVECSSASFDDNPKIPLDSTTQCYEDVGDDLVIYSRVIQWYGAKDKITDSPPAGVLTISTPTGFPSGTTSAAVNITSTVSTDVSFIESKNLRYRYDTGPYTGDIFLKNNMTVLSNPIAAGSLSCTISPESIHRIRSSTDPSYPIPSNIQPSQSDQTITLGIFPTTSSCRTALNATSTSTSEYPMITEQDIRVTLYGKYDKKPYFFSPRDNMTQAQPIPACTADTIHTSNNTLKGDTKVCYGVDRADLVILTKRVFGFYGAADTVTAPTNPIDLDSSGPTTPTTPSTPTPSALLSLAPPASYSSSPSYSAISIISSAGNTTGYTSERNNDTTFTHTTDLSTAIGDLFLVHHVPILSNPFFSGVTDEFPPCAALLHTLATVPPNLVPNFAVPDNITPNTKSSLVGLGLDFRNGTGGVPACSPDPEAVASDPLITGKELRFTLYNQSDQSPYYFSPRDNITKAQQIPACSSTNLDTADQTLKGDNSMCYGEHGDHMVIITKRLAGFYGAANTVTPPTNPVDLTIGAAPPDPSTPDPPDPVTPVTPPVTTDPSDLLTISGTIPDPVFTSTTVISDAGVKTGYITTSSSNGHTFTHTNILADRIGSIFVPHEPRIPSNDIFTTARSECDLFPIDIKTALDNNYVTGLAIPDNIKPKAKTNLVALGFDMRNASGASVSCSPDLESNNNPGPLLLDKALYITLSNKSKKAPYYISPRDNITSAQQITACSSDNFNTNNQTLKGTTEMCYGKNGTDMVILTKRLAGFYGAANNVTAVSSPDPSIPDPTDPPLPAGTIKIPPPSDFPSDVDDLGLGLDATTTTVGNTYTAELTPFGDNRHVSVDGPQIGEILVPSTNTIMANPIFLLSQDVIEFSCNDILVKNLNDTLDSISNIQPTNPIGLGYVFDDLRDSTCLDLFNATSDYPLIVEKELRFTIYGKYDKKPYYISLPEKINTAQPIPACSSTNFDTDNQTLKGDTKMCYGVNGTNMVIITKRISGYYGAADTVTPPTNPADLTATAPDLDVTTSRQDISGIGSVAAFNITSGSLGLDMGGIDSSGKYTYSPAGSTQKGHIYIPDSTYLISNIDLFVISDNLKKCISGYMASTEHTGAGFTLPDDVTEGVAYGFAYNNGPETCTLAAAAMNVPFDTSTTFHVVLYDQAGKQGYSYLRAAGTNSSQDIAACSSTNFDNDTKILIHPTKQCYTDVGDDLVIYSRVMQWYGAKTPSTPGTTPGTTDPTSRDNVKGIGTNPLSDGLFNITTSAAGNGSIDASGKYSYIASGAKQKGHIYIAPDTIIYDDLFVAADVGKTCIQGHVIPSDYSPSFSRPSDVSDGTAYGFAGINGPDSDTCTLKLSHLVGQLNTSKTFQVVLYDQAGKVGYYYLRSIGINTAQEIAKCSSTIFDNSTKTLKGTTRYCYKNVGGDLVIYAKVIQMYGAKTAGDTGADINTVSRDDVYGIGVNINFNITTSATGNGSIDTFGKYTWSAVGTQPKGHIYIPPDTIIYDDLFAADDVGKTCMQGRVIPSDYSSIISRPSDLSDGTAYGFLYLVGADSDTCTLKNTAFIGQFNTSNTLQVVLYGQAGKEGYYYHPGININTSQDMTECSSTIFDDTTKTFKGTTKHCYADVGDDLVIYTKVLLWYGAKTPSTPDLLSIPKPSNFPQLQPVSTHLVQYVDDPGQETAFRHYVVDDTKYDIDNDIGVVIQDKPNGAVGNVHVSGYTSIDNYTLTSSMAISECSIDLWSLSDLINKDLVPSFNIPDNISPNDNITGLGFDFNATHISDPCKTDIESSTEHITTRKDLRFTIYNSTGKQPYYFSPRENIVQAQPIPACTTDTIYTSNYTLKNTTEMCYGKDGKDLVILTKRLAFYGVNDTGSPSGTTPTPGAKTPLPLLTIPKPDDMPEPEKRGLTAAYNASKRDYWYVRTNITYFIETPSSSIGDVRVPSPDRLVLEQNTLLDNYKKPSICPGSFQSVGNILKGDFTQRAGGINTVVNLKIPSNIEEQTSDTIIAGGINWSPSIESDKIKCPLDLEEQSNYPIFTTKELRYTLYNQSDKKAYHFSPRENILAAQPIPACSNDNFDITDQTLKGDTKMCYGKHENNMVIITKTLTGFYGATASITVTSPSDDDSDMANAPTFGTSPLTGEQLVTCGYKMDDTCRDITAYHVQYERDTIQTNTTHTFALKALAPNMIDSFTLAFGVPDIGSPISAAEAYITAKLAVNYTSPSYYNIVQVTVHDPNNIIDYDIANTEIARVSCSGGTLECAQVTFSDVLFRETLYHEPFVVMITDTLLYTSINYMNEGILVTGTPLNEQPTISPGITVDTGDIRPTKLVLVRTDKVNDLWADAFGNTWSRNSFGNYVIVQYAPYAGTVPVCSDINDRLCAPFKAKLDWHNQRMIELRDSLYTAYTTKAYAEIDDIFTYEFGDMDSRTRTLINLGWLTE